MSKDKHKGVQRRKVVEANLKRIDNPTREAKLQYVDVKREVKRLVKDGKVKLKRGTKWGEKNPPPKKFRKRGDHTLYTANRTHLVPAVEIIATGDVVVIPRGRKPVVRKFKLKQFTKVRISEIFDWE